MTPCVRLATVLLAGIAWQSCKGQEATDSPAKEPAAPLVEEAAQPSETPPKPLAAPKGAARINPKARLWVDRKRGQVLVDGVICLRDGVLEMFACPRGTKEHESIVSLDSPAFLVHGALLSVGAKPGRPVQWEPKYAPPRGDRIDITIQWRKEGSEALQSIDARQWIRNLRNGKPMQEHWVFAGSGFWKDEETGREYYLAESGDMVCVSNFGTAMLDIPAMSPSSAEGLLFEAFTERIPPLATPVRLVMTPKAGNGKPASNKESGKDFIKGLAPKAPKPQKENPSEPPTD